MVLSSLPLQTTHVIVSYAELCGGSVSLSAGESERQREQKCIAGAGSTHLPLQKPLDGLPFAVSFCLLLHTRLRPGLY